MLITLFTDRPKEVHKALQGQLDMKISLHTETSLQNTEAMSIRREARDQGHTALAVVRTLRGGGVSPRWKEVSDLCYTYVDGKVAMTKNRNAEVAVIEQDPVVAALSQMGAL